jgi:hypothetical protein
LFLSVLVLVAEFKGLVESSFGQEMAKTCPGGPKSTKACEFVGTLDETCWFIAGARQRCGRHPDRKQHLVSIPPESKFARLASPPGNALRVTARQANSGG